jgi:Tfp pilus assembly protein PilE
MSKKLNNLKAYTLMELVIVVVIIGMMVIFAVPAFDKYGKNQAFSQKIEEVQALISQTQTFAKNPEKDVLMYETVSDPANKFVLKRCLQVSAGRCSSVAGEFSVVKEVALLPSEVRQISGTTESYLACPTNLGTPCATNSADKFSFRDTDVSSSLKTVDYTIKISPFIISSRRF